MKTMLALFALIALTVSAQAQCVGPTASFSYSSAVVCPQVIVPSVQIVQPQVIVQPAFVQTYAVPAVTVCPQVQVQAAFVPSVSYGANFAAVGYGGAQFNTFGAHASFNRFNTFHGVGINRFGFHAGGFGASAAVVNGGFGASASLVSGNSAIAAAGANSVKIRKGLFGRTIVKAK
jgi:hypothetical protein